MKLNEMRNSLHGGSKVRYEMAEYFEKEVLSHLPQDVHVDTLGPVKENNIAYTIRNRAEYIESCIGTAKDYGRDKIILLMRESCIGTNIESIEIPHTKPFKSLGNDAAFVATMDEEPDSRWEVFKTYHSDKISGVSYPLCTVIKLTEKGVQYMSDHYFMWGGRGMKEIYLVLVGYVPKDESFAKTLHLMSLSIRDILNKRSRFSMKQCVSVGKKAETKQFVENILKTQEQHKRELLQNIEKEKTILNGFLLSLTPIELMLQNADQFTEKVRAEIENANKLSGIKNVSIKTNGDFVMQTEHIYIAQNPQYDGDRNLLPPKYWDIGRLEIKVNTNGIAYCKNFTRQVNGYGGYSSGHPHSVTRDGELCLGDIQLVVYELIKKYEYASLAGILLNYARSVNLSDEAGKTVTRWPVVEQQALSNS